MTIGSVHWRGVLHFLNKFHKTKQYKTDSLGRVDMHSIDTFIPGNVLSRTKPINPPTNILVLSNTVRIWSTMSLPARREKEQVTPTESINSN